MKHETTSDKPQAEGYFLYDLKNKKFEGCNLNKETKTIIRWVLIVDIFRLILPGVWIVLICIYKVDVSGPASITLGASGLYSIGSWLKSKRGNKSP